MQKNSEIYLSNNKKTHCDQNEVQKLINSILHHQQYPFLTELQEKLQKNKLQMVRILKQNPPVGVYKGQSKELWDKFFDFFINFLKSEIGPRGECSKKIRKQMKEKQQYYNQLLKHFNLSCQNHIREIMMKIKFYIPCPEYIEQQRVMQNIQKYQNNLKLIRDKDSPLYGSITSGLLKKHGNEFNCEGEVSVLEQRYSEILARAMQNEKKLSEILQQNKDYQHYIKTKNALDKYFVEWKEADSNMGKESCKRGVSFEEKVFQDVLPLIIFYEKEHLKLHSKVQVFTNSKWIPKSLGEIDISIGYFDEIQQKWKISVLIQCKSRLFDLREAYHQVSLEKNSANKQMSLAELKYLKNLKKKQSQKPKESKQQKEKVSQEKIEAFQQNKISKKFLSIKRGQAQLIENHRFYIITTLPENEFTLPIESKMKQTIQKYTKNMFTEDIESQPLYKKAFERFQSVLSPYNWFSEYEKKIKGKSNILVLS